MAWCAARVPPHACLTKQLHRHTPYDPPRDQLDACTLSMTVPVRAICPSRSEPNQLSIPDAPHQIGLSCSAPGCGEKHFQRRHPVARQVEGPPHPHRLNLLQMSTCRTLTNARPRDWLGRDLHSKAIGMSCAPTSLRGDARHRHRTHDLGPGHCALHPSSPGARNTGTSAGSG